MEIDLSAVDAFAAQAHAGQKYGQEDYIEHPRRVAGRLSSPLEKAVALLHDTVEDTAVTVEDIFHRFGGEIAQAVDFMTHRKEEDYLAVYIPRIAELPVARRVKIADLQENISRSEISGGDFLRRIPKYQKALIFLQRVEQSQMHW